jgi:NDP-sugar pyrophosphorylase family protein
MKFDFGDGNGPVPAHKHRNGGGIVADTATVDPTAYVGENARVFGDAIVSDASKILDNSQVFGNAVVSEHAIICDDASISGTASVSYNYEIFGNCVVTKTPKAILGFEHPIVITDNNVIVGCHCETHEYWKEHGAAIIKVNGFTTKTAIKLNNYILEMIDLHTTAYNAE